MRRAEAVAERPHGERGLEVDAVDLAGAIEQRVDQRQPDGLRFRARRDGAEQARLSRRQARIDVAPQLLGAVGQVDALEGAGGLDGAPGPCLPGRSGPHRRRRTAASCCGERRQNRKRLA